MSRVIVKNLPQKCTEEKLRELFCCCGEVTDVRLMRTRRGTTRKFGFVGFNSAQHAQSALKQFNKTYIGASKVEVDLAKPYGDQSLDRPWSKYSNQSRGQEFKGHEPDDVKTEIGEAMKGYEELKDDPEFQEFVNVHTHTSKVKTWANSAADDGKGRGKAGRGNPGVVRKGEDSVTTGVSLDGGGVDRGALEGEDVTIPREDSAISLGTSDLDYLKTKVVGTGGYCSDSLPVSVSGEECEGNAGAEAAQAVATTPYTIKMLGLPFKATEAQIHVFFHPLKVVAIRFTKDPEGRPSGRAYADFQSEGDLKSALRRNKDCIAHRYIELFHDEPRAEKSAGSAECVENQLKPWELKAAMEGKVGDVESITESGRIFVRNLPFSAKEEELSELFAAFGPLAEVTMPLDKTTNKSTGLAFVTFMLPEHAAKAYQELDGQIFQGRLLHLLPARARRSRRDEAPAELSSFKKKKASKLRSEAGSGHNWNSLFLGANAVVDVMAGKYSADKGDILDPSSAGISAAVRVALGETQIVRETREFLQCHGVNLELFEQNQPKRSKNVIMVKNLPSGTVSCDMVKLFEPFGPLIQVILPPAAISAMVEFAEATHAKKAFSKLAYTNFKHLPLYLEWAPLNILDKPVQQDPPGLEAGSPQQDGDEEEQGGSSSSVFVKNLSFSTQEEALKELFSQVGGVKSVSIAKKRNPKDPAVPLSMGYGFVEYRSQDLALTAIKQLQHSKLEGHVLELKLSHRKTNLPTQHTAKKQGTLTKQKSAKILVRNIPFEASRREVKDLFSTFGNLKMVRLPKKLSADGGGEHRGFGFVEFSTKQDAKSAFDALSYSTHLYGRRLVLEWAEQEESLEAIRKRTAEHFHSSGAKRTKSEGQTLITTLEKSTAA